MTTDREDVDHVAWDAARFEVFRLRATIHPSMPLQPDAYALGSDRRTILTGDELAAWFVHAPKPQICRAVRSSAGVVVVLNDAPQPGSPPHTWYVHTRQMLQDGLGDASFSLSAAIRPLVAAARVALEDATVLCVRTDAMQVFPYSAIDRWEREYALSFDNWLLSSLDEASRPDPPRLPYAEARARGTVCILWVGRRPPALS